MDPRPGAALATRAGAVVDASAAMVDRAVLLGGTVAHGAPDAPARTDAAGSVLVTLHAGPPRLRKRWSIPLGLVRPFPEPLYGVASRHEAALQGELETTRTGSDLIGAGVHAAADSGGR